MSNVSLVLLTFNRPDRMRFQQARLAELADKVCEIIIVDNYSDEPVTEILSAETGFQLIRTEKNLGAVGRNRGMEVARGDIVITLDDDVYGISGEDISVLHELFSREDVAAVNFKIQEESTGKITDWCHPYDPVTGVDIEMETNDISEGAVAFRRKALERVGLYPESFFISHEGPDLAYRLINDGWKVIYCPRIVVTHAYEQTARQNWRRYYFDTRNQLWFVLRNLSFFYGVKKLAIGWGSMFFYAMRDGYLKYWFCAVWDALAGIPTALRSRTAPTPVARRRWREIEMNRPGFWRMFRKRVFGREVRI